VKKQKEGMMPGEKGKRREIGEQAEEHRLTHQQGQEFDAFRSMGVVSPGGTHWDVAAMSSEQLQQMLSHRQDGTLRNWGKITPEQLETLGEDRTRHVQGWRNEGVDAAVHQKAARAASNAAYKAQNKEKIAAYNAAYKAENKEQIAAYKAVYNAQNKEKKAAYDATYYAENKKKKAAYNAAYNAENKEQIAAYKAAYHAEMKRSGEKEGAKAAGREAGKQASKRWKLEPWSPEASSRTQARGSKRERSERSPSAREAVPAGPGESGEVRGTFPLPVDQDFGVAPPKKFRVSSASAFQRYLPHLNE
jgi:hypothetical protein